MAGIDARTGVERVTVECDGVSIAAEISGRGSPVLLLHGYPETKAMWRDVAADLADSYTVVASDLRGYGDSAKPPGEVYSKREMARDQCALMRELGFGRFAVVGHDRGGRVAHRIALDRPDLVTAVAVVDIVPTVHMFETVNRAMAEAYFHWFFLTRPDGLPERMIASSREEWLRSRFAHRSISGDVPSPEVFEEYLQAFDDDTIRSSCADYRAAATIDLDHDRADREAGSVVSAPLLALWGERSYVGSAFDVLEVWRGFGRDVRGAAIRADHYVAEENPSATSAALRSFLASEGVVW